MPDKILILDFGSQWTLVIAKKIRQAKIFCEVHPPTVSIDWIRAWQAKGIILSGSPCSVNEENFIAADEAIFTLGIPILGICYGMQWMAKVFGGHVQSACQREFGGVMLEFDQQCKLFADLPPMPLNVWMSHHDQVDILPAGFARAAHSKNCDIAAFVDVKRRFYGVQFHPEVDHSESGAHILKNFALGICGIRPNWQLDQHYIANSITKIQQQVGEDHVLLALSGGVDSTVAAVLLKKALGKRLICIFVDHGLLRLHEAEEVKAILAEQDITPVYIDASEIFLARLAGILDPEEKRKCIGQLFIDVFAQEAKKIAGAKWLAQGTIYPDVIESNNAHTAAIKSHHNVGGLPEKMPLKLLEPLRDLFKDEVRILGLALGLSPRLVYRHPFPGPGLAVRILGEVKPDYCEILRRADAVFIEVLRANRNAQTGKTWYEEVSQAFAVFLPLQSVGVMGDARTYEYMIALRAVQTQDFMSANWAQLPHVLLAEAAHRIINEVPGVNRVVYDISNKPPATIEWE